MGKYKLPFHEVPLYGIGAVVTVLNVMLRSSALPLIRPPLLLT